MTVRLIHIADTHLRSTPKFTAQTPRDLFDAFEEAIFIALREGMNGVPTALVHCGDLFDNPSPADETLNRVIEILSEMEDSKSATPDVFFISGNHDEQGGSAPALDQVIADTHAERLTTAPVVLGNDDIALYGVNHHENNALVDGSLSFEPPSENVPVAVCLHGTVGSNRHIRHVGYSPVTYTVPEIVEAIPFNVTTLLCGHLHKSNWKTNINPTVLYPGAHECVRPNLKGSFSMVNRIEVTNYPKNSYDGFVERVGTHARPWIEFTFEVNNSTGPSDVASAVFERWETLLHEKHPEFKDRYNLWYGIEGVKPPNIDASITTPDGSGVSEDFIKEVVTNLNDWGHFHKLHLTYGVDIGGWTFTKTRLVQP